MHANVARNPFHTDSFKNVGLVFLLYLLQEIIWYLTELSNIYGKYGPGPVHTQVLNVLEGWLSFL